MFIVHKTTYPTSGHSFVCSNWLTKERKMVFNKRNLMSTILIVIVSLSKNSAPFLSVMEVCIEQMERYCYQSDVTDALNCARSEIIYWTENDPFVPSFSIKYRQKIVENLEPVIKDMPLPSEFCNDKNEFIYRKCYNNVKKVFKMNSKSRIFEHAFMKTSENIILSEHEGDYYFAVNYLIEISRHINFSNHIESPQAYCYNQVTATGRGNLLMEDP